MFLGAIGIDVAKDIDRGIAALAGCSRLIVDLRRNTGGGIGGLRLMSYLTPGKLEVGYSPTRKRRERGNRREELTRFGRIPSHKATLIWLAARYAFVDKSILVVTEGLGNQTFHGRVVVLVNEHTASAGEMVSAFAEENNLATIIGTHTPGRLLSGSAYKVGHGYILGLPVAAYLTWQGRMLENNGIVPKFSSGGPAIFGRSRQNVRFTSLRVPQRSAHALETRAHRLRSCLSRHLSGRVRWFNGTRD